MQRQLQQKKKLLLSKSRKESLSVNKKSASKKNKSAENKKKNANDKKKSERDRRESDTRGKIENPRKRKTRLKRCVPNKTKNCRMRFSG